MHKSVRIWSIANKTIEILWWLKRDNFLNLALEPWRAWKLNGRLTIVFVSRSAGMLIRNCLQGAAVRAACQAKFLNTATLDAKKHSTESFACQDAFVFAVSSRGTHTHRNWQILFDSVCLFTWVILSPKFLERLLAKLEALTHRHGVQRYREILSQAEREKIGPPPSPLGSNHIEASHLQIHIERILLREYLENPRNTSITSPSWLKLHARRKAVPWQFKEWTKSPISGIFWKWPAFSSNWVCPLQVFPWPVPPGNVD